MPSARRNYGTLSWHNVMAECRLCSKLTHSSNDGIVGSELCRTCLDLTYTENACSDNCYDEAAKTYQNPFTCPDHGAEYTRLHALQAKQKAQAVVAREARGARQTVRNATRADAKLAKLAAWDAKPRCKWCLSYRAGRKTDLCAHHNEHLPWHPAPTAYDQEERERMLRERAWMVREIEALGATAPACPFPARIEGM